MRSAIIAAAAAQRLASGAPLLASRKSDSLEPPHPSRRPGHPPDDPAFADFRHDRWCSSISRRLFPHGRHSAAARRMDAAERRLEAALHEAAGSICARSATRRPVDADDVRGRAARHGPARCPACRGKRSGANAARPIAASPSTRASSGGAVDNVASRTAPATSKPERPAGVAHIGVHPAHGAGACFVARLIARHNWRKGRGDRRGTVQLLPHPSTLAAVGVWILDNKDVADRASRSPTASFLQPTAVGAGLLWMLYLAVRPCVRRFWPSTLMSSVAAVARQWRERPLNRPRHPLRRRAQHSDLHFTAVGGTCAGAPELAGRPACRSAGTARHVDGDRALNRSSTSS